LRELEPVIEEEGFEIARVTKYGFSVTTPQMKRNVRIQFTRKALGIVDDKKDEDVDVLRERLACFREKLMVNMGRYHGGAVPDYSDGSHFSAFQCYFADNKRRNETAIPSFAAAALQ